MIWISAFLLLASPTDVQNTLAIDYRSKKNLDQYWLPLDHPVREKLDLLFSQPGITETVQSLIEVGFEIIHAIPFHPVIARHPLVKGYIFKIYPDSQKHTIEGISSAEWLLRRCEGATKIRNIIKKKEILHFKVPDKWLYPLPSMKHHPLLLIATDMELEGGMAIKTAWKTEITPRHLDELYYILKKGYGSIDLICNIPYTTKGYFVFIDTEKPKQEFDLNRVNKHLSKDMCRYWQMLID